MNSLAMPLWAQYLCGGLAGYLLGTSSMAWYLAKLFRVDLRAGGSGNLGASNALIIMGKWAGVLTAIHDIGKAVLAVLLARWLFPQAELLPIAAGMACVLGHIYPFWLKFRGGKGFASYLGVVLATDWRAFLAIGVVILLVTFLSDYIVFGTMSTVLSFPVYLVLMVSWQAAAIMCVASACIIYKHRENFMRIARHEEVGLRRALSGKDKKV